jgi:poly-gamma-glutamate synthesis protein (capsule biosynthesis protein)
MLRRTLIALLFAEMLLGSGLVAYGYWQKSKVPSAPTPVATSKIQPEKPTATLPEPTLKLLFGGDVMLGRQVETNIRRYGVAWPLEKIAVTTKKADLFIVNLESPFRTDAAPTANGSLILRGYPPAVEGLVNAGVDFVTLANNHIPDMRLTGLKETKSILKSNGIGFSGAGETASQAKATAIIGVHGVKIGFISCTYSVNFNSNGVYYNTCSAEGVKSQISTLNDSVDLTVLLAHFGVEYAANANAMQKSVAHAAVEAGADLVIGHHPHVPQPYEKYKGKYIFYSLGNLVFDQQPGEWRDRSALVEITVVDKKIKSFQLLPYQIYSYGQPRFLTGAAAEAVVERFTP